MKKGKGGKASMMCVHCGTPVDAVYVEDSPGNIRLSNCASAVTKLSRTYYVVYSAQVACCQHFFRIAQLKGNLPETLDCSEFVDATLKLRDAAISLCPVLNEIFQLPVQRLSINQEELLCRIEVATRNVEVVMTVDRSLLSLAMEDQGTYNNSTTDSHSFMAGNKILDECDASPALGKDPHKATKIAMASQVLNDASVLQGNCKNVSNPKMKLPFLSCSSRYKNLIFDVGGVLLAPNLDSIRGTRLHPSRFKFMLRSHTWVQFHEGKLSWDETLQKVSFENGYDAQDVQTFLDRARASLSPVPEIVQMVDALSAVGKLRLFCMTNAAKEDYDYMLATFPDLFQNIERVFYSAAVGIRKPNFGYFQHVLDETGCKPSETILIDDTLQNVVAAESLGFTAILVGESIKETVNLITYHLRTEDERQAAAHDYLLRKRGVENSPSLTSDGIRVPVHFDHFVIAELLDDPNFLPVHEAPKTGTFNFFAPKERLAQRDQLTNASRHKNFPDDKDTTAVALSALYKFSKVDMKTINATLDKMLETVTEDGILQLYFDRLRPRIDAVAHTNICYLFHLASRPEPARKTEEFMYNVLKSRTYLRGSVYYPLPEAFLYMLARLVHGFKEHFERAGFVQVLAKRVRERMGMQGSAIALAMRVLTCEMCGIRNRRDRKQLALLQNLDGSWDVCPFYTYNDPQSWFGNDLSTTAFAFAALQRV